MAEVASGITCAALPTLRPLFKRYFPASLSGAIGEIGTGPSSRARGNSSAGIDIKARISGPQPIKNHWGISSRCCAEEPVLYSEDNESQVKLRWHHDEEMAMTELSPLPSTRKTAGSRVAGHPITGRDVGSWVPCWGSY